MQVGIDEGHYKVIERVTDVDVDHGPCTGVVISNGIGEPVTVWMYDDDPDRVSLHIGD